MENFEVKSQPWRRTILDWRGVTTASNLLAVSPKLHNTTPDLGGCHRPRPVGRASAVKTPLAAVPLALRGRVVAVPFARDLSHILY